MTHTDALVVFQDRNIRRLKYGDEWYYSVVDIIAVLTDSPTPRQYWGKMKEREFLALQLSPIWVQLKLPSQDGKARLTDCVTTKNAFRLIQSIPSRKAEPFKQWLAQLAQDRVDEIENPELAQDRVKEYYELKGYPQDWIDKRLRGIAIRQELTGEWKSRGVTADADYAILTNEISKATFGLTVQEYKRFKGLDKKQQNLRDHMNDWELIFTMMGEKATTDIARMRDARGFSQNKTAASRGGQLANHARTELEHELGTSVLTSDNFLGLRDPKKTRKKLMRNTPKN